MTTPPEPQVGEALNEALKMIELARSHLASITASRRDLGPLATQAQTAGWALSEARARIEDALSLSGEKVGMREALEAIRGRATEARETAQNLLAQYASNRNPSYLASAYTMAAKHDWLIEAVAEIEAALGLPPPVVVEKIDGSVAISPSEIASPSLVSEPANRPVMHDGRCLHCSFCTKCNHEVAALVAGNTAFICSECVDLCNVVLYERLVALTEDGSQTPPASDGEGSVANGEAIPTEPKSSELHTGAGKP